MGDRYKETFLRHVGIISDRDQKRIKDSTIGIGGLGLGGSIFINLVRMGFQNFHVADPDSYERTNVNRQRLAKESTLKKRKDDALLEEALDINPDLKIKTFPSGVKPENVHSFFEGVDWAVDVIDVFALEDKLLFNQVARERGIPVASCGAVGFSSSVVVFNHETPSFEELTGMKANAPYEENIQRFLQFIAPEIPEYMGEQMGRAMNGSGNIPFVVSGVEMAAASCSTEIVKSFLRLGNRPVAPQGIHLDLAKLEARIFEAKWSSRSVLHLIQHEKKAA